MNGAVSKTVRGGFVPRGFESLPLRFRPYIAGAGYLMIRNLALAERPVRLLAMGVATS